MPTFKIDLNPKVLAWARAESRYKEDEVASILGIKADDYLGWEQDGKEIKYSDVKKLAKLYKRQISTFFLEDVPTKTKTPTEYRNLTSSYHELSKEAYLYVRRTSYYLELYREIQGEEVIRKQYEWLSKVRKHPGAQATLLRQILDAPLSEQRNNGTKPFKYWREKFEKELNIFIFQFPLEEKEYDGFSYTVDGKPYGITLNSRIPDTRKVFTLFHELGHIIEGQSGICLVNHTTNNVEAKCNYFAAEFLMPEDQIIPVISYNELKDNALGLGVSPEAYLIRLKTLKLIEPTLYKELKQVINDKNRSYVKPKQDGGPPPLVTVKSQRGEKFFDFVLSQFDSGKMSPSLVRDVLGIRVVGLSRQDN
ncbi:MAG TPA: ImmA/IrrE family metallo-endopeptidase [Candidatus Saccharimonadales bacterium]